MEKKVVKKKEDKYIEACLNCKLPVGNCKGTCTKKEILRNSMQKQ